MIIKFLEIGKILKTRFKCGFPPIKLSKIHCKNQVPLKA